MKQQRQRGKKTVKPHTITKAVTHIRLIEANPGKLAVSEGCEILAHAAPCGMEEAARLAVVQPPAQFVRQRA